MPLDSDIQNADDHLYVQFYEYEKEPYRGVDFVRIMNPGDKTNVYDQPAQEQHKMRFPRHWIAYQRAKMGEAGFIVGSPLADWLLDRPDDLTDNQVAELTALGFQSVEQIASASDHQIQRVGMGGAGLRERARNYLANKHRPAADAELAATKAELAEMKAQMAQMMAMMGEAKRGPGRPRKDPADGQLHADLGAADGG